MAFEPERITKHHVLEGIKKIELEKIELEPSTKYDVIINGKYYPPKEVMRFAHEIMNGEHIWERSGGEPTNKYLTALGFEVTDKINEDETSITEDGFITLLRSIGEENATTFFINASNLLNQLLLKENDSRLTFGTSGNKQLTITIGQRYCLVLRPFEEFPFQFIAENKLKNNELMQVSSFDGKPVAFYCRSKNISSFQENFNEIIKGSQTELNRTQISGYRKFNNPIFEKVSYDLIYKEKIFEKAFGKKLKLTGTIWKLGCNWGSGKPSFYKTIKEKNIIIGVEDKKYNVGDLIAVTEGHKVNAIALIKNLPISIVDKSELKETFEKYEIDYESWVNISDSEWYELDNEDVFYYQLQQGICKVQNGEIRKKVTDLWNSRNANYWIFQGNPNVFDFETAIRNNILEDWTVTAHKDKIKIGDKVILWITGKNAGCYALAEVTKETQTINNSKDSHLWKSEDKGTLKAGIKITHSLIDKPILWSTIKGIEGLENLKVGNQGTNFSATKQEYRIIENFVKTNFSQKNIESKMYPKNIILYGPPGTGKTYNSIDKAVEIASPESYAINNHKFNKTQFDELRKQGQIEFVTFHQNYTYEDFMVGIRPNVNETSDTLSFKKHNGIFYELVKRAKENYENSLKDEQTISKENWVKEKFEEFKEYIQTEIEENGKFEIKNKVSVYSVEEEVFIYTGEKENGELWKNQRIGMHYEALINIYLSDVKNRKDIKALENVPSLEKQHATYSFELIQKFKDFLNNNNYKFQSSIIKKALLKNYVLVIDEINRANISKVFGELITLLEDDKRLGEENELKITLPNGEKDFGVPPNLYLIGTMNTADKSIALVDIALRRRFEFIGFYPLYEGFDIDAIDLLKQINDAIFKEKKSADYLIGHAYFMNGQPIQSILMNKVIPLLMEYFSGKTEIVSRIFSDTFYKVNYDTVNYCWNITKE